MITVLYGYGNAMTELNWLIYNLLITIAITVLKMIKIRLLWGGGERVYNI
ncbi:Uncharacterised protein [Escherichia coli]|nr:Uncharacterised protein [Escherichia coli]